MLRKVINDRDGLATDGWVSIDPSDAEVIEKVFKKNIHEGEKALMLAVLQDAAECFQTYVLATKPREKGLFQEAEEWILEKNSDWFFSFENICETLQLHPNYIRKGLLRWKEAKLNSRDVQPHAASRAKLARTCIAPYFSQVFQNCISLSYETFPQKMNTVDLERLKKKEDAAIKIIDIWPRIFQLLVYRQLYALGIRISNIDSEIEKELKKSA